MIGHLIIISDEEFCEVCGEQLAPIYDSVGCSSPEPEALIVVGFTPHNHNQEDWNENEF